MRKSSSASSGPRWLGWIDRSMGETARPKLRAAALPRRWHWLATVCNYPTKNRNPLTHIHTNTKDMQTVDENLPETRRFITTNLLSITICLFWDESRRWVWPHSTTVQFGMACWRNGASVWSNSQLHSVGFHSRRLEIHNAQGVFCNCMIYF